jgi:hypothetical protein
MSQTKAQLIDNLVQALSFTGTSSAPANGVYLSATNQLSFATNTTERLRIDSAGQLEAVSLGSASAPTYSWTTDPDTGVYSPGANQVAISTNGTPRLFVDASGNVGINKVALSQAFHVLSASGGTTARFENSSTGNFIDFFETGGGTRMGYIGHVTSTGMFVHNDKNGPIVFDTNNTERMRLDSSGGFQFKGAGTAGVTQAVSFNGSAPVNSLVIDSSGNVSSNTNTFFIDRANSRVGLGTSSPSWLLQVAGNAAVIQENSFLGVDATTSPRLGIVKKSGASPVFAAGSATAITFSHSSASDITGVSSNTYTPRLTIDTSGRVGIGTTSPGVLLDCQGTGTQFIRVRTNDTSGSAVGVLRAEYLGGGGGTNTNVELRVGDGYSYLVTTTNHPLLFGSNGSERARIDSSGTFRVRGSTSNTAGVNDAVQLNGSAPANSLLLDASGRLLVGTSTSRTVEDLLGNGPQGLIQIEAANSDAIMSIISAGTSDAGRAGTLSLGRHRNSTVGATPTIVQSGDTLGAICFAGGDGTDMRTKGASIACQVDGTPGVDDMPGRLVFSTTADGASSPTERMRIGNQGTTTVLPAANLNAIVARARDGASSGGPFLYLGYHSATDITNGTYCFSVATNGNVQNTNGSYTAISDAKLKENIVDASSQWDDLKSIKIRNWNFKEETGHETHRQIGPIAQELETVCPGLVFEAPDLDEDGNETGEVTKGVNQSVLYMKAVKALQEAMERIETLEVEVAALKAQ